MALMNLKFYSQSLGMQTEVLAVVPQKNTDGEIGVKTAAGNRKYKCLYLLHGQSDDFSIWLRRTSIERYATAYGICVVMPSAVRSYYTDMKYGEKYYTYIAKELPAIMSEFLNISDRREDTYVAGLSMGGYGALKIGLRECDRFCCAAGLSPVSDINQILTDKALSVPIFGDVEKVPAGEDLFCLAEKNAENPNRPRLFIGIGTEDFLYSDTLRLKKKLEDLKYDLTYRESSGNHCWEFWDEYIQYVLKWMLNPQ